MSTENNSQPVELDQVDLINAARIMEHAVSRNAFQIEELVNVAPVVAKFVKLAKQIEADIAAQQAALAEQEAADTEGDE